MKTTKHLFLLLSLFLANVAFSQNTQGNKKQEGDDWKSAEDFKKAEPKILEYIKWLEDNPTANQDIKQQKSQVVLRWLTAVPYLGVVEINGQFIENVQDSKYKYPNGLSTTYMFGKAAYYFENHNMDAVKSSTRGVIALITFYKNMLKVDKTATNPIMEKYIKLQQENKLEEFVKEELKKSPY
ncbi:MAG: hypothetical protein NTX03_08390 [Bacteroidetes bacterium]|nr:hypothetical protein [Bacteroidota bacterium]